MLNEFKILFLKCEIILKVEAKDSELDDDIGRKMYLMIGYTTTSRQLEKDNGRYYDQGQSLEFAGIFFSQSEYEELKRGRKALTQKIAEYPRDHFYVGEPLKTICLGWRFFYSDGAYVGVTFKNGTRRIIGLPIELVKTQLYFAGGLVTNDMFVGWKQFVHPFLLSIVAQQDMVSIDCWMPQWNTDRWDKVSRNLTILQPIPPSFFKGGVDVYFELGDEAKHLEWRVVGGVPESRIGVAKDERNILKRLTRNLNREDSEENEVEDSFQVLFNVTLENDNGAGTTEDGNGIVTIVKVGFVKKITYEMQGLYVCTAENVGGKMTQAIRVIVQDTNIQYS